MKKKVSLRVVTLLIASAFSLSAFSQQLEVSSKTKKEDTGQGNFDQEIHYVNDVNGKVRRSFLRFFGEKPGVLWSKTSENAFVACYQENSRTNYVFMGNSGVVEYTVSHYGENQLSKKVRHIVKSNFYDDSIIHVTEVHKEDSTWFFITVMDKTAIKTIRLMEDDWEVIEEIKRQ